MAEHHALQIALDGLQLAAVVVRHVGGRNARNLGHDVFNLGLANGFLALRRHQDALCRTGFVNHVNRLVGQVAVVDVLGAQLGSGLQRSHGVLDVVVLFKTRLEAFEDVHGLLNRRLDHVDLLETTAQGGVFFKDATVFGEGRCANALELAARQRRLEQVRRIQRAARSRTRANERVDFVDEQNRVGLSLQVLDHAFQALLKVAAVFGAGQQSAHVQRVHDGLGQDFRHIALGDAPCQTFGNRGFTHASLAHQERVVLAAAAQDLNRALDLVLAANQRVNLAVFGSLVQVLCELLKWRSLLVLFRRGTALFLLGLV